VIKRTNGVPLFVEELTRAVLENGDAKLSERAIPVTLYDSLMARMDRLGTARELLQTGAVIGNEFSYQLLQAIHPDGNGDFQQALDALVNAELLYVRGIAPDASYRFKHALIQDAAYDALLKSQRKELHRKIAQTISAKFPGLKAAQPEVLARHWTEAGETEQAILEWSRAGRTAEDRHAFVEAEQSFQHAQALLKELPESVERDSRELQLRNSLQSMLQITRGFGAVETIEAASRVGALANKVGDRLQVIQSLFNSCLHTFLMGDLSAAAGFAEEALTLAVRENNRVWIAVMRSMQVTVQYLRGDLAGAENCFASGQNFFEEAHFKEDPNGGAISTFAYASFNAWVLGRADIARKRLAKMRSLVNGANPHHVARADEFAAWLHAYMRDNETAGALAARALELAEKHRFPYGAATAQSYLGYVRAQLGRADEGLTLIGEATGALDEVGNRVGVPGHLTRLATAQLFAGAIGDGLDTVEQALNFSSDMAIWRPETLRIRGELLFKQRNLQSAEADFRDSIAMARSMGAKAWELRTTMSLARLLIQDGRRGEARTALAEIYNWFTEGFDTADLNDAKALLDELGNQL